MKKLTIILLSLTLLFSCGCEKVYLTKDDPFIVEKKTRVSTDINNCNCIFKKKTWNKSISLRLKRSIIITNCDYYEVGDTIKLRKP